MIDLFYLKHRRKEFFSNPSFGAYIFVGVFFGAMVLMVSVGLNNGWDVIKRFIVSQLEIDSIHVPSLILWMLAISDLLFKIFIPEPFPKLFYYHTLNVRPRDLKVGYLIEVIFNLWFVLLFVLEFTVASLCVADLGLGMASIIGLLLIWLMNTMISVFNLSLANTKVTAAIVLVLICLQLLIASFPESLPVTSELSFLLIALGALGIFSALAYRQLSVIFEQVLKSEKGSTGEFTTNLDLFKDPLMQLEVATIMRNKRTRGTLLTNLLIIPYFLFLNNVTSESQSYQVMFSILVSGLFIFQMGTYIFAWEGSFFDLLMTRFTPRQFIEHKFRFFTYTSIIFSIIFSICLFFTHRSAALMPLTFCLFNIGWNIPFVINNGFSNKEKIDLNRSVFMNYQGFNGMVIVTMFGAMIPPIIIHAILFSNFGAISASLGLAGLGLFGLTLRGVFISKLSKKLESKKHYLSACYKS